MRLFNVISLGLLATQSLAFGFGRRTGVRGEVQRSEEFKEKRTTLSARLSAEEQYEEDLAEEKRSLEARQLRDQGDNVITDGQFRYVTIFRTVSAVETKVRWDKIFFFFLTLLTTIYPDCYGR